MIIDEWSIVAESRTELPYAERVATVLAGQSEPHLLTGEQYLETLADGRRLIAPDGTEIENVAAHPVTSAAASTFAAIMDQQFDPRLREVVTYVDPETNRRKSRGWQVPTTRQHLFARREQIGVTTRQTLGFFGRPPDYGPALALGFLAIIDRVESESPEFAENIRRFVQTAGERNLLSTDLIGDNQSDHRVPRNDRPSTLRVVEERSDGIVLRGSKSAGSSGPLAHMFTLTTKLGEGLGPEGAIWAVVPVNSDGLSLVMREPTVSSGASREDHPLNVNGEEMDQIVIFDDVFLPRECVFNVGNLDLLQLHLDICVFAMWHILTRLSYRAQIFAGTAQVITEILGRENVPGVRRAVADIQLYAETLKAFSIAAITESQSWNGVEVPNPGIVSAGRLHSITNYERVVYLLQDLCGQGLISRWPEKVWDHPEFGPRLEAFLPGVGVTAREKNRFFNFVYDLTASANAQRVALFENVNAAPPAAVAELVYRNPERAKWARVVREFAGIPAESGART
ncbi:4-nitrophenol 4-monooxygenase/4-nitrocatechol 2-monooxygenase, oxygenase component [Baekduia alba]|uniref:4-hydroxyphenylacetate 3-hydroxylase N-terminal domain-containing protein n=1 Tax=Baekduia alba TaxID=2997333 RepID=UPI00234157E5|nr:4-hydroxyphenylacetate 3-hydroxylase N-terminal domain-containing protein [Baekduia alba]WCB93347.1 4-nitrophenol 4-monooxygenase/4-nitrocatechol 2-monooxygenase, oxygenase component [Baekduia alba]